MADTTRELKTALDHWTAGRRGAARDLLKRLAARDPKHPGVNQLYAVTLAEEKQFERAIYFMQRAIAADPGFAEFHVGLGMIKSNTPDWRGAVAAFRRALEVDPRHAGAMALLGLILCDKGEVKEAEGLLRRAMEVDPGRVDAALTLSRLLLETFRVGEALTLLRKLDAAHPDDAEVLSQLCFAQNYAWDMRAEETVEAARRYGRVVARMTPPLPRVALKAGDRDRPLRVGYLSPDLREHSVSYFLEPVLRGHDRGRFEVFCYHTGGHVDGTTERLRGLCGAGWRHAYMVKDEELAETIRKDGIDILVELAGHSSQQRLALMARRPAPVQASYIGYAATTGLAEIDYRIVDAVTDPAGAERLAVERLERVEGCFLCYRPPADAPEAGDEAAIVQGHDRRHGGVTFGSFNVVSKVSDPAVEVWARIMKSVPGSRLVLKSKAIEQPETRARILERFGRAGIDASRIECLGRVESPREHLAAYGKMDIALDPFPYNGTTTTCEALWMGVPVVTLAGDRHVARVGASVLTAAGLGDLVANTPNEHIAIAAALAGDGERRAELRRTLRHRVAASRLCDSAAHARALEAAYRRMWLRHCESGGVRA